MVFRDDRDALREQVDALRRDLDESRKEASALRDKLAGYEKRPSLPGKRPLLTLVAPMALILISLAGGIAFLLSSMDRQSNETFVAEHSPAFSTALPHDVPVAVPPSHSLGVGRVVLTSAGESPVPMDATCEAWLSTSARECRLTLRCAGRELYAVDEQHGYFECARFHSPVPGTPVDWRTDDGDPMLTVDWSRHVVHVEDGWFVDVQFGIEAPEQPRPAP